MTISSRTSRAVSAVALVLGLVFASGAFAQDKKDTMSKDAMGNDTMAKDGMKKDEMKK